MESVSGVEMEHLSLANIKEMINAGAVEGVENWRLKIHVCG